MYMLLEKIKKLATNIKIKTEIKDEFDATAATPIVNSHETIVGSTNEKRNLLGDTKTVAEIKIEKETLIEYIVPSRTIPENLLGDLLTPNIQRQGQCTGPPFSCEFCGYSLPTKNALYKHNQRKHKFEKSFSRNVMPLPLNCFFCPKVFTKMSALRQHLDEKHSKVNFVCEDCGHKLPTKNALCQHRLRKHPESRRYHKRVFKFKCSLCSQTFITAQSLNLHKKKIHMKKAVETDGKTWIQCEDCDHKLPTRNALYQHRLRKHRNKKVATNCETRVNCNERLRSDLLESLEILPALKQMVERF